MEPRALLRSLFDPLSRVERRFERIARRLAPYDLHAEDDDAPFTADALMGELYGPRRVGRFLGFYSRAGLMKAVEAYGLLEHIHSRGYRRVHVELDLPADGPHRLTLWGESPAGAQCLLVDMALRIGLPEGWPAGLDPAGAGVLIVEWISSQDPAAPVDPARLAPGQLYAGLGLGVELAALTGIIAWRLGLPAVVACPAWYHNAVFYSHRAHFIDPDVEGRFRAMRRDLCDGTVWETSWAFERGWVRGREELDDHVVLVDPVRWRGHPQLWPLDEGLDLASRTPGWDARVAQVYAHVSYGIDPRRSGKRPAS